MAHAFDDLTGRTFGRLNVVRFDHFDRHGVSYYWVQCECGAPPKIVQRCNLISGGTVSCNCWRLEQSAARCGEKSPVFRHGRCGAGKNRHDYEAWAWKNHIRVSQKLKRQAAA